MDRGIAPAAARRPLSTRKAKTLESCPSHTGIRDEKINLIWVIGHGGWNLCLRFTSPNGG